MLSKRTKPYDPDSLDRATRLRRNLGDLVSRNELPCNRIASVVNDFNACAPTVLSELASRPNKKGNNLMAKCFMPFHIYMILLSASVASKNIEI